MRLPDRESTRVVLLGVGRYEDPALHDLPAVPHNLEDLAAALTDERGLGLPADHCVVAHNVDSVAAAGEIIEASAAAADDLLLVYYCGHGLLDSRGELRLALPGTSTDRLRWTSIEASLVREAIAESPASNRVLVLDCCFSGRAIEAMGDPSSVVSGQIEIRGTVTLASTAANSTSHAPTGHRNTAFTGALLRTLRDGVPGGPSLLTLDSIYQNLLRLSRTDGFPRPEQRGTNTTSDHLALGPNRAFDEPPLPRNPVVGIGLGRVATLAGGASLEPASSNRPGLRSSDVKSVAFSKPPLGKRGYNEDEVDAFLDLIEAFITRFEIGSDLGSLTAEDIHNVAFSKPASGKRGYNEDEVDAFLDLVEAEVQSIRSIRSVDAVEGSSDRDTWHPAVPGDEPVSQFAVHRSGTVAVTVLDTTEAKSIRVNQGPYDQGSGLEEYTEIAAGDGAKYFAVRTRVLNDGRIGIDLTGAEAVAAFVVDANDRRFDPIEHLDRIPGNPRPMVRLQPGFECEMTWVHRVPAAAAATAWEFRDTGSVAHEDGPTRVALT